MDRRDERATDAVRLQLFQSQADDADDEDATNSQSHTANDAAVTDYENDDDEDMTLSRHSPVDDPLTEFASGLLAADSNDRDNALVDGANSESVAPGFGQNSPVNNFRHRNWTAESVLMDDDMNRRGPVNDGHESSLPSHRLSMSPGDHENFDDDRDPNYATQRPDTLGAINVTAAAAAGGALSGFAGPPAARPVHYQVAAAVRAWPIEPEDADSVGTLHLGRRTRGAGMDQLEMLNHQRQLMVDDDEDDIGGENFAHDDGGGDGSEFCDEEDDDDEEEDEDETGLGSGNQCESTEADQYKMDPEADQSGAVDAAQDCLAAAENMADNVLPLLIAGDGVRFGGGCGPAGHRRRHTDGAAAASGDVSASRDSMDEPEEDQADSRHNARQSDSRDCARPEPLASQQKETSDSAHSHPVPVGSDENRKHGTAALKQHPQSAFSIPKPRMTGKSKPNSSNRPVPSVRQSKSNTDIVFKPIGASSAAKLANQSVPRTQITSKASDCFSAAAGTVQGESAHQHLADKPQLSVLTDGGMLLSQDRKNAGGNIESDPVRRAGKPVHHDVNTAVGGRSMWSRETGWNSMEHQPVVVWNNAGPTSSCVSLPCHLPGDGAAVAPPSANSSSSQQITPQKANSHGAFHGLNSSVDISPIQPPSSSTSSRPLSVNGLYVVDPASVSSLLPSAGDSFIGTQGSPLQFSSNKIRYDGVAVPEIKDMETVRGQLHKLLAMSECNIPGIM